jgi:hypothetical protein
MNRKHYHEHSGPILHIHTYYEIKIGKGFIQLLTIFLIKIHDPIKYSRLYISPTITLDKKTCKDTFHESLQYHFQAFVDPFGTFVLSVEQHHQVSLLHFG